MAPNATTPAVAATWRGPRRRCGGSPAWRGCGGGRRPESVPAGAGDRGGGTRGGRARDGERKSTRRSSCSWCGTGASPRPASKSCLASAILGARKPLTNPSARGCNSTRHVPRPSPPAQAGRLSSAASAPLGRHSGPRPWAPLGRRWGGALGPHRDPVGVARGRRCPLPRPHGPPQATDLSGLTRRSQHAQHIAENSIRTTDCAPRHFEKSTAP